ncbi:MAG: tetratricopeptide repeat protein [Elusimicrobia bacterium]|nr:tetratricopeptide repeat protein [Elusimicrobiota bacterium]
MNDDERAKELAAIEAKIPILKRRIQANPKDVEAHFELGMAYAFKGCLDEAIQEFADAAYLAPETPLAKEASFKVEMLRSLKHLKESPGST